MKKLLKLLSAALITAAMFMSCGNPASTTVPDQDDGETVEQFLQKLVEFGTGITSDGLLKFTYKRVLGKVYEAAYFYDNEKWTTGNPEFDSDPSYNGNEIIDIIRKISNNKYEQFGDGKTIYIYEFVNNNLQITWVIPELIQRFGTSSTFIKQ